jgi:hypothetical protein
MGDGGVYRWRGQGTAHRMTSPWYPVRVLLCALLRRLISAPHPIIRETAGRAIAMVFGVVFSAHAESAQILRGMGHMVT